MSTRGVEAAPVPRSAPERLLRMKLGRGTTMAKALVVTLGLAVLVCGFDLQAARGVQLASPSRTWATPGK